MTAATEIEALIEAVRRVGAEVAAAHADEVDRDARFPREAIAALREQRALSAGIPRELGGLGASTRDLCAMTMALGRSCAATAMIFAMHHIKVASLARHALASPLLRAYLAEVCAEQRLVASVTSEVGVGGDLRSSVCAVEPDPAGFRVVKDATTVSYGEHADDLLLTARRAPDAPANDQVLLLLRRGDFQLEKTSTWDTLGMRGTCSPGFKITGRGAAGQIVPDPFAEIAAQSMVPYSHLLWSGVWLGIAADATARARAFVRAEARRKPGAMPPGAMRVAELVAELQLARNNLRAVADVFDGIAGPSRLGKSEVLSSMGFAIQVNNLKVETSRLAVDVVSRALLVTGMAGYRQGTSASVGRHLRDAWSAQLMINNDRILATNASLLLVHKEDGA